MYILLTLLALFCFFDVYYFIRSIIVSLHGMFKSRINILEESSISSICLTTDLDFMLHMNNARYLRECDFGRYSFWMRTGAWQTICQMGGYFTNAGNNIRYRKSIRLLDRYEICTKILYWDDKSFYMEHTFVRTRDKFICAIALMKQTVIGVTPSDVVAKLYPNFVKPDPSPELQKWMESNQLSSERLRKTL